MTEHTRYTVDGKDSIEDLAAAIVWHAESMEEYAGRGNEWGVDSCRQKIQNGLDRIEELQEERP